MLYGVLSVDVFFGESEFQVLMRLIDMFDDQIRLVKKGDHIGMMNIYFDT